MVRHVWTLVIAACLVSTNHAQSPKRLFVLQEPDQVVEYDLATYLAGRAVKVPRRLLEHPEYLSINAAGQMLFLPPAGAEWGSGDMAAAGDRAWLWDGRRAREWPLEVPSAPPGVAARRIVAETAARWFLSAGGTFLFCFENLFEKSMDVDEPARELSVGNAARVLRTDLTGGRMQAIATRPSSGSCECTTGTCSESCSEWSLWAPEGVLDDFFLMTRITPGQLDTTVHETLLYQRIGVTWQFRKLAQPIDRPLTASAKGDVLVSAVDDGGCCGWVNEGNDQTLLIRNGKSLPVFDEAVRFNNRNYDVSFYTDNARLAPGHQLLAHTIVSTAKPGDELRVSSNGKADALELARVRAAIDDAPSVEVVPLEAPSKPVAAIRHVSLVGWLSDRELLVAQDGRLAVYDTRGNRVKDTGIRVRAAADAFLP